MGPFDAAKPTLLENSEVFVVIKVLESLYSFNIQTNGAKIIISFYRILKVYMVLIVIWINYFCSDP